MTKIAWDRKTVSVVLLAVVLPVSLVVAFRLLGGGTRISENITLDPVVWTFQRPHPNQHVIIEDKLEPSYSSDGLSAAFHMCLSDYIPRVGSLNFDTLRMILEMNATATTPNGFIESVCIILREEYSASVVELVDLHFDFKNLTLVRKAEGINLASMSLDGINNPTRVALSAEAAWMLDSPNTQSHQIEAAYEIVYYNGTAYNKVVQPFQLNILGAEE